MAQLSEALIGHARASHRTRRRMTFISASPAATKYVRGQNDRQFIADMLQFRRLGWDRRSLGTKRWALAHSATSSGRASAEL
jgi:hypothetical protein